jgi:phage terminase large subunit
LAKIQIPQKFKPLYAHDQRYTVITGGRGGTKSFSVACFLVMLTFKANHVIMFTRLTMVSAHISIIPELTEKIKLMGLTKYFEVTKNEIINLQSGSKILFMGLRC